MARAPRYAVSWSAERGLYEWSAQGHVVRRFDAEDDAVWLSWLTESTSFAFHGRLGALNVYQERRPRGGRYWYAYHTGHDGIRKRYLGRTAQVTLALLEATAQALASAAAPATVAAASPLSEVQQPVLLAAKLTPPRPPRSLVERPRLLSALDGALSTPLTLLSASAGWGKTTLLSAWAWKHEDCVAWLSLDELDNSPTRFWVALIAALRRATHVPPDLGETALALLQSPQPPPLSACLAVLLQDLEIWQAQSTPRVLVLDDYQVITDPSIHESLTFFLEHLPADLHLILASRVDPDLPLARLRVRGQLTELRAADLHFHPAEASALLQQAVGSVGAPLSEDEVTALQRRTEGWAAGLQLAALSLRQRQQDERSSWIAAWTGSQRYLLDYVQEEILSQRPDDLQRFLLHTALLTRLSAPICQAVLAAPDAPDAPDAPALDRQTCQAMLEALERANLFVVPLDEERRWYRLHDLFREALLARLSNHEPALLPQLHLRAARWYEAVGELHEAIAHALAAEDFAYAAHLMEQAAPRYWLRGEALTVQSWLAALSDADLWQHAQLALQATLRLLEALHATTEAFYTHAQAQVEDTLTRLEALLRKHKEGTGRSEGAPASQEEFLVIGRRLRLLRALIESRVILQRGDKARLAYLARELEGLAQVEEDISWQMIPLTVNCWLTEGFHREGALLLPRLLEARERADQEGELLASLRVRVWLIYAYLRAAQWPQVERECLAGLALLAQSGVRSQSAGYFQMFLVEAYYAWNWLDEAVSALHETIRVAQEWQQVDILAIGQLNLALVNLAHGMLSGADQALSQAEALVQHEPLAHLPSRVSAFRVQYWLAAGELEAARRWAEQASFSPDPDRWDPNDLWSVRILVRVALAEHHTSQALHLLERFRAPLTRPGNPLSAIEWLALRVVALYQAGEREQAYDATVRLLALTEPAGDLRLYLDLGEPMRQALRAWRNAHRQDQPQAVSSAILAYVSRLLAAFEQEPHGARRLLEATTPALVGSSAPQASTRSSVPGLSLTRREQEVLRLLAEGASNQEIAQALMVELSTVKKHVSNLLGKLGVTSRTQAIAQARSRMLL